MVNGDAQAPASEAGDDPARRTPRSSDRVLALLTAVVDGLGVDAATGRTLTQLADAVGLAASTASRQLGSLEAAGLVRREGGIYTVGPAMVRLAYRVVGGNRLPTLAQPVLDAVAASTRESALLAVAHDDRALYVAAADGSHTLRVTGWLGRDVPRSGTAVGRVLAGAVAVGEVTVSHDTVEPGVTAVSGPVRGASSHPVAAISVLGPSFRLQGPRLEQATAAVLAGAAELGTLLGGPDR